MRLKLFFAGFSLHKNLEDNEHLGRTWSRAEGIIVLSNAIDDLLTTPICSPHHSHTLPEISE